MSVIGYKIAEDYESGRVCGWPERKYPGLAKANFDLLNDQGVFRSFSGYAAPQGKRKMFLHWAARKVLGKDIPNIPQETGDCVSQGAKHATEILTCTQIIGQAARSQNPQAVYEAARLKWRPVFAPYYYGTGRIYIGNGQLGNQEGSWGSWQVAAMKYGSLFEDEEGCPPYSGYCANEWGSKRKYIDKWQPKAINFPVKATAPIKTWEYIKDSIWSGYPITTASDIGYSMEPGRDGFHKQNAVWSHQMMIFGFDETWDEEYALIMNNWGAIHGNLKDFQTGEDLPVGVLRVRRRDVEKHLAGSGENYSFSNFDGFPDQSAILERELFTLL